MITQTRAFALKLIWITAALALLWSASGLAQSNLLQQGLGLISSGGSSTGSLTQGEMGDGLKEALRVGTEAVVSRLGKTDGFNTDKAIHIPLPGQLGTVQKALKAAGY